MSTAAIELLKQAAETCAVNAKIQHLEGRIDEASLNIRNALEYLHAAEELEVNDKL